MPSDRAALALARFGLGPRPGDTARIAADPEGALLAELRPAVALLAGPDLPTSAEALTELRQLQEERKRARAAAAMPKTVAMTTAAPDMAATAGSSMVAPGTQSASAKPAKPDNVPARIYQAEFTARMDRAGSADIGYVERLVAFWTNHFAIGVSVGEIERTLVGAFEREAIRPNVLGRFEDMLFAATRHPAMLAYLNNNVSIGPNSPAGKRTNRGLNENHAREIMELHTIGVDGGYTQADVTSLAKVLTGWTFAYQTRGAIEAGSFQFREDAHEPGPQTVMGKVYAEPGEEQGIAAIADLAAKPATAHHLATKLARAFVSDNPPPALVERLAADFRNSGGDLTSLSRTLVSSPEAWNGPGKFRMPQEFLWASLRAIDARPPPALALRILRSLGETPWDAGSPAGYDPSDAMWLAPDAMTGRLDAAQLIAQHAAPDLQPVALTDDILAGRASPATREAIARAESKAQAFALLLMSPEFQRT
jgi:uncharacterized protein (DUF1800 family)